MVEYVGEIGYLFEVISVVWLWRGRRRSCHNLALSRLLHLRYEEEDRFF
jgi:hypothetical protein